MTGVVKSTSEQAQADRRFAGDWLLRDSPDRQPAPLRTDTCAEPSRRQRRTQTRQGPRRIRPRVRARATPRRFAQLSPWRNRMRPPNMCSSSPSAHRSSSRIYASLWANLPPAASAPHLSLGIINVKTKNILKSTYIPNLTEKGSSIQISCLLIIMRSLCLNHPRTHTNRHMSADTITNHTDLFSSGNV